jgi:hypothetical protein
MEAGKIVRETKVARGPEALAALFNDTRLELTRIGLEAGPCRTCPGDGGGLGIEGIGAAGREAAWGEAGEGRAGAQTRGCVASDVV